MQDVFPSETAGDGKYRPQYLKQSDGQGLGLKLRRVSCQNCGFPGCDTTKHDSSGGSLDGSGGMGVITQQGSGPDANQSYNNGGGCPLCGSKNYKSGNPAYNEFGDRKESENILI